MINKVGFGSFKVSNLERRLDRLSEGKGIRIVPDSIGSAKVCFLATGMDKSEESSGFVTLFGHNMEGEIATISPKVIGGYCLTHTCLPRSFNVSDIDKVKKQVYITDSLALITRMHHKKQAEAARQLKWERPATT